MFLGSWDKKFFSYDSLMPPPSVLRPRCHGPYQPHDVTTPAMCVSGGHTYTMHKIYTVIFLNKVDHDKRYF